MSRMPDYVEFDPDGDITLLLPSENEDTAEKTEETDKPNEVEETQETNTKDAHRLQSPTNDDDITRPLEVRMRVSSKHLILASSVFQVLLRGSFGESQALRSAGRAEFQLPDDNAHAMEIILNIIHGRFRKVPRDIDSRTLTRISVLIDKYCLHEATEVFTDMWFENLKANPPRTFTDELMSWMCISWVFRKSVSFEAVTKIAMRESEGKIESDLPIPGRILGQ
jgi:hypothetical protein